MIVPRAIRTEKSCSAAALTADHPQILDGDGRLVAVATVIHHSMKSSCGEYPPRWSAVKGGRHNRVW